MAAAGDDVTVVFAPVSTTVEYGQYWEITAEVGNAECLVEGCDDTSFDVIIESSSYGEAVSTPIFDGGVFISSFDLSTIAPPDTYEVRGVMVNEDDFQMASSNTNGSLTITPAALAVEATVIPDDHQPEGAIVSAQLTGKFVDAVDECFGSTECHIPLPNGTWKLTVKNADGTIAHEEEIATKAAASRYASFYLHGVTPSTDYTVDATFTPASSESANYTVSPANGVAFTSAEAPAAGDPDAPAVPEVEVEVASGPTLALWLVILVSVIVVGLAVAAGVFWLLLRRRRAAASDPDDDNAEPIEGELL